MAPADDGWHHAVRQKLKPWRDRLVHGLGGTMPADSPRGITYDELVRLLYPSLPDELRPEVDRAAGGVGAAGPPGFLSPRLDPATGDPRRGRTDPLRPQGMRAAPSRPTAGRLSAVSCSQ